MGGPVALLALIVAAFVVNAVLRGQGATRLASGAALLLVGLGLGPMLLGAFDADELTMIRPAMQVGVCWLGMLFGLRIHRAERLPSRLAGVTAMVLETGVTAIGVALALGALVPQLAVMRFRGPPGSVFDPGVASTLAIAFAAGPLPLLLGLVAAPSAPTLIAWARDRLGAAGPVTHTLAALAARDSWVPLIGLTLLCGFMPPASVAPRLAASPGLALAAQLALAAIVVLAFVLLTDRNADGDQETAWVSLIGLVLIAAGVSSLLALPGITIAFLAGVGIAWSTPSRHFIAHVVTVTERPVALLLMLMAGLQLSFAPSAWLAAVLALVLRFVLRVAIGPLLGPLLSIGPEVGFGLLGSGAATLAIAVQINLLEGGLMGQAALWTAAVLMVFNDLISPQLLRWLLRRSREIGAPVSQAPGVPPGIGEVAAR